MSIVNDNLNKIKETDREERHLEAILNGTINDRDSKRNLSLEQREVLRRYDKHSKANGLKVGTRRNYLVALKHFGLFIKKRFEDVTQSDIINYFSSVKMRPRTIHDRKIRVKAFCQWLNMPGVVESIKIKRTNLLELPKILTKEEIKRLVDCCDNLRDRTLIMVLWESACRRGEVVNMNVGDVTFDDYGVRMIVKGKTGMRKIRLIDSVPDLKAYLNFHPFKDDPNKPLFINMKRHGERLESNGIYQIIRKLKKRAKIKKNVHPHILRHSRLTELAKDFHESELKIIAGWNGDSRMPKVYVHLSDEDIDKKLLEKKGLLPTKEKKKDLLEPKRCAFCGELNSGSDKICSNPTCNMPLDQKAAMELQQKRRIIEEKIDRIDRLLKQNPKLLEKLK